MAEKEAHKTLGRAIADSAWAVGGQPRKVEITGTSPQSWPLDGPEGREVGSQEEIHSGNSGRRDN